LSKRSFHLGSLYDAPESAYIPKNVFFLREEVLIYDAPSLPGKDNRFDQELPSIRGSKVWRKGSRPVAWLDDMVEVLVSDNREGYEKG
jgi:hypothetical protein